MSGSSSPVSPVSPLWCGIDCSTQSLKVLLIDSEHVIRHEVAVNFDQSLAQHFPGMKAGITRATYGLPQDVEQHIIEQVAPHARAAALRHQLALLHPERCTD